MKIAYLNGIYRKNSIYGGSVHVNQFIENAIALGHKVYTTSNDEHQETLKLPKNRWRRFRLLQKIGVFYYRIEFELPLGSRWFKFPYFNLVGRPLIVWEFNTTPDFGKIVGKSKIEIERTKKKFQKKSKYCDLAVCVSNRLKGYVVENFNIKNAITVPNASDPKSFAPEIEIISSNAINEINLNVVWIGSANLKWHNLELLREAANILYKRQGASDPRIIFHIIGPGLDSNIDMPPNVIYHGFVEYQKLPNWLAAMDVGICIYEPGPADYSSPLKLFDYLSSGLVVVGTDQPQVREVLQQLGRLDLIVQQYDSKALSSVLIKLFNDRSILSHLGEAGRQLVIDRYSWKKNVKDIMNAIESCLPRR